MCVVVVVVFLGEAGDKRFFQLNECYLISSGKRLILFIFMVFVLLGGGGGGGHSCNISHSISSTPFMMSIGY